MKKTLSFLAMFILLGKAQGVDNISLSGPDEPVSGFARSSVILPFQLVPHINVAQFGIWYYRPDKSNTPVFYYMDQPVIEYIAVDYKHRTFLVGDLREGDLSLRVDNLTLEDNGEYACWLQSKTWNIYTTVNLTVKVMGCSPLMSYSDVEQSVQVNITCVSDGWFPAPTLKWKVSNGEGAYMTSSNVFTTGDDGLMSVSSWLLVDPSKSKWVSCSVGLSDQDRKESRVAPHSHTDLCLWKPYFIALLVVLLLNVVLIGILCKKGLIRCRDFQVTNVADERTPLQVGINLKERAVDSTV